MQTLAVIEKRRYTPEEYLALEDAAETRSEYRNGEIIPMTGGTTNHNRISLNLAGSINLVPSMAWWRQFASMDVASSSMNSRGKSTVAPRKLFE